MAEVTLEICEWCRGPLRRLSMEMEGLGFCNRVCYVAWCGQRWDRQFFEINKSTVSIKPKRKAREIKKLLAEMEEK